MSVINDGTCAHGNTVCGSHCTPLPIPIDAGLSREECARRGALGIIENHERLVARCRQLEDAVKRLRGSRRRDYGGLLKALFALVPEGDTP